MICWESIVERVAVSARGVVPLQDSEAIHDDLRGRALAAERFNKPADVVRRCRTVYWLDQRLLQGKFVDAWG